MGGDDSVNVLNEETEKLIEGHGATFIKEDLCLSLLYFTGNLSAFQVLTLELNPHLRWDFKKSFQFSLSSQRDSSLGI